MHGLWTSWRHYLQSSLSDPEHQQLTQIYESALDGSSTIDRSVLVHSLQDLIKLIFEATRTQVVVLIDEYDKPLASLKSDEKSVEMAKEASSILRDIRNS